MASAREMRLRIRSVKNIAQVTRAMETVSASKVRRAQAAVQATRPYAENAWKVLVHLARQPGHESLHPLLNERDQIRKVLVVMISGDRGLAGAYNTNILRFTLTAFNSFPSEVNYLAVGRKGRDLLLRRRKQVIGEFSNLPAAPSFADVSAIGRLAIEDFQQGIIDQVYLAFTKFDSMVRQTPTLTKLLPLNVEETDRLVGLKKDIRPSHSVFSYEPDQSEILGTIIMRFTELQIYQAILESLASEHAARMVAMHNATENANELVEDLQLDYNKARQQTITNEMLDIAGGAEALAKTAALTTED